jgi:hypothetical protein
MRFALAALLLPLAACSGAGSSIIDSAFPTARMGPESRLAGVDTTGFTMQRVLGRPDSVAPLTEDQSLTTREPDGRTLRDLLDVEGTRPSVFDQQERGPGTGDPVSPRTRGSGSPPRSSALPEVQPRVVTAPPPPVPTLPQTPAGPQRTLPPGTVLPGGAVVGGAVGNTAPTIGPSGQSGTAVRDGNTVTLFGADGTIRTVPVPPR